MSDQIHIPPKPPLSGLAVVSLVCGVLGFFTFGLAGIIAVILGHMALSRISRSCEPQRGREVAIVGVVTGYLGVLLFFGFCFVIHKLLADGGIAKYRQASSDFKSFESALEMYRVNAGVYPSKEQGLDALVAKPVLAPVPEKWVKIFRKLPADPWGNAYEYRFPGRRNPEEPEIICAGKDGIMGTPDDVSSADP